MSEDKKKEPSKEIEEDIIEPIVEEEVIEDVVVEEPVVEEDVLEEEYNVVDDEDDELDDGADGDEFEDDSEGYGDQYVGPAKRESFIDEQGNVIDKSDVTPLDVIKLTAQEANITIKDPAPSCKRCYGRGYTGIESKSRQPRPCSCIYPPRCPNDEANENIYDAMHINASPNREQRRRMKKNMIRLMKQQKRQELREKKNPKVKEKKAKEKKVT